MRIAPDPSRLAALLAALFVTSAGGCTFGEGLDPPLDQLYFPTAILRSPGGNALYVVSSDFDLQYAGGTVMALDLKAIRQKILPIPRELRLGRSAKDSCAKVDLEPNANPILNPGPCAPVDAVPFVRSSRIIGAFASQATLAQNPDGEGLRMFVSVRGDPSITTFLLADDRASDPEDPFVLECGADFGEAIGGRCSASYRIGEDPAKTTRNLTLPIEPVGIASSPDGKAIVTVHQTEQSASLLLNRWNPAGNESIATLEFITAGLAVGPTEIAAVPEPALLRSPFLPAPILHRSAFFATHRASRDVVQLRYVEDDGVPARPFLQSAGGFVVGTNSDGSDSRGIAIDDSERRACDAACQVHFEGCAPDCADAFYDCQVACATTPMRLFIANRSPPSLLVGRVDTHLVEEGGVVTGMFESGAAPEMFPLLQGPSRVAVGQVIGDDGALQTRAFVVSFDSRSVAIYDPVAHRIEAFIRTGRGPHALAFDAGLDEEGQPFAHVYVAHFTDSYLGVVDLDRREPSTYGQMFATIGVPVPPKESN